MLNFEVLTETKSQKLKLLMLWYWRAHGACSTMSQLFSFNKKQLISQFSGFSFVFYFPKKKWKDRKRNSPGGCAQRTSPMFAPRVILTHTCHLSPRHVVWWACPRPVQFDAGEMCPIRGVTHARSLLRPVDPSVGATCPAGTIYFQQL